MRSFYLLILVMLSLAEVIFTAFYIYLAQELDAVALTGAALYFGAVVSLYDCYVQYKYQSRKKRLIENLISSEDIKPESATV